MTNRMAEKQAAGHYRPRFDVDERGQWHARLLPGTLRLPVVFHGYATAWPFAYVSELLETPHHAFRAFKNNRPVIIVRNECNSTP